jgi:hypothetical protein
LNYKQLLILGLLFSYSCNTQEPVITVDKKQVLKDSTKIETHKEIVTPVKVSDSKTIESIKAIFGDDLSFSIKSYLTKLDIQNENDFIGLYQRLLVLQAEFSLKKSINFDLYYPNLVNDTSINQEIAPLTFGCIEECTSPFISINTSKLMEFAISSNSKKAVDFTHALQYAYPRIENDYVGFMEYCDECFGATSNIGDNRIYEFLKLCAPLSNDNSILFARLFQIKEESIDLALGDKFRYSSDSVKTELQKWIAEDLVPKNKIELVINKIEEIKNQSETNQFNYVSESYPEMHN